MSNSSGKLFEEFAPVSAEQWKQKTIADIKGADFDKRMVWKPIDGFDVQPLYRLEDLDPLAYLDVVPGQFPFTRGTKKTNNDWFIRQDIQVENPKQANAKALEILQKGITSVGFKIADTNNFTAQDVATLLADIDLTAIETCFEIGKGKTSFMKLFVAFVSSKGFDKSKVFGSVNCDYIGNFMLKGAFCNDSQEICENSLTEMLQIAKELPKFSTFAVHGDIVSNAGGTVTQELACALAIGADYLTTATTKGINAGAFAPKMKFNFAVTANYFMEIAKFRAARLLWAKIVEAYEPTCDCNDYCECEETVGTCSCCSSKTCTCAGKMKVHATTSTWNKTLYDSYVNMLRTQTEAMSATLGGVDSLTVLPFNSVYEKTTDFSERIARNQQSLLKEESYFDKIVDPSAGSYYIESLTDKLAESAWKLFLTIQDKGGFLEAFKAGYIQEIIKLSAITRSKNIATRRDNVLGVNQFPNLNEVQSNELDARLFTAESSKSEKAIVEPLHMYRGAQAMELLRYKTDQYSKSKGRPKVFMLTIGNLTFRKARAQFACNFFACAGFEVIDNNGFATVEAGIEAAKANGAQIIVICSSDEEYAEVAVPIFEKLQDKIVVIAGAPACTEDLQAKGIKNFISVKSNLLETLQNYQTLLGI
jgi:methylmalonyl-CoA mutase